MALPWSDGGGFMPDTKAELLADVIVVAAIVFLFSFFTGLDAQVAYAVSSPGSYFFSSVDKDSSNVLFLNEDQLDNINFATKNRIGVASLGEEIGMCAGVMENGRISMLRPAEGFKNTSRSSVTFSCSKPRELIIHSQPSYSSKLSAEDKSFKGEFQPEYSCIVFSELAASPVTGRVGGLNCWSIGEGGEFTSVPVVLKG